MNNIDTVGFGGAIKALGDGWIEGPLVRFTDASNPDLEGEFFDRDKTDYGIKSFPATTPTYFQHGLDKVLGVKSLGEAELRRDEFGIWAKTWLDRSDKYKSFLYDAAVEGRLGWSSGSVAHLARRERVGKAMMYTNWPIAEASLTFIPVDPNNVVMPIKSFSESMVDSPLLAIKSVSGSSKLPLADRKVKWDASAADKRVRKWAGAEEKPNAKYRSAFFWYDDKAPEKFGSYKLQFADVIGGELKAIPRGIFAVAAVLEGSRGGVDIPDSDKSKIKAKVAGYYRRMAKEFKDEDIKVPWATKSLYFGEMIESDMVQSATWTLTQVLICNLCDLTYDETCTVDEKVERMQQMLTEFQMLMEELWEGMFGDDEIGEDDEAKAAVKSLREKFQSTPQTSAEAMSNAIGAIKHAVGMWKQDVASAIITHATKSGAILSKKNGNNLKTQRQTLAGVRNDVIEVMSAMDSMMDEAGVDYNDLATESEKEDPAMKSLQDKFRETDAILEKVKRITTIR